MSYKTRSNVAHIEADVAEAMATLHAINKGNSAASDALARLETFAAVALRVMAESKPERVRRAAKVVELQSLIPKPADHRPHPFAQAATAALTE